LYPVFGAAHGEFFTPEANYPPDGANLRAAFLKAIVFPHASRFKRG